MVNLGWVDENSLIKILKNINKLKSWRITQPILIPGGFLILKLKDIKEIEKNNLEKEIKLKIRSYKINNLINIQILF